MKWKPRRKKRAWRPCKELGAARHAREAGSPFLAPNDPPGSCRRPSPTGFRGRKGQLGPPRCLLPPGTALASRLRSCLFSFVLATSGLPSLLLGPRHSFSEPSPTKLSLPPSPGSPGGTLLNPVLTSQASSHTTHQQDATQR